MNTEIIPPIGTDENSYTLGYINGYSDKEAEEDLALTWEDVDTIVRLWMDTLDHEDGTKEELYTKIADAFNKLKAEKK